MISALYGSLRSVSMFFVWPFKTPNLTVPRRGLLFVPEARLKPRGFLSEPWSYGRSCLKKSGRQKNGDLLKILFFKYTFFFPSPPSISWSYFFLFLSFFHTDLQKFLCLFLLLALLGFLSSARSCTTNNLKISFSVKTIMIIIITYTGVKSAF